MLKNKMIYGLLALFVGFTMSFNSVNAQVTEEGDVNPQNSFTGQVVDAETGQALSEVTVKIEGMDKEATTDENGEFKFDNLNPDEGTQSTNTEGGMEEANPGEITFTINHEGYQEFSKTLRIDELRQEGQQAQDERMKFKLEPEDEEY
jgi:hypothetical protein